MSMRKILKNWNFEARYGMRGEECCFTAKLASLKKCAQMVKTFNKTHCKLFKNIDFAEAEKRVMLGMRLNDEV